MSQYQYDMIYVLFGTDKAIKVNTAEQYTAPNRTQRVEKTTSNICPNIK